MGRVECINHSCKMRRQRSSHWHPAWLPRSEGNSLLIFLLGVIVFVLTLLFLGVFGYLDFRAWCQRPIVIAGIPEIPVETLKQAHRYHGICFSEQDATGEWFFVTNGQRGRLLPY